MDPIRVLPVAYREFAIRRDLGGEWEHAPDSWALVMNVPAPVMLQALCTRMVLAPDMRPMALLWASGTRSGDRHLISFYRGQIHIYILRHGCVSGYISTSAPGWYFNDPVELFNYTLLTGPLLGEADCRAMADRLRELLPE
jgi:hypothetical protein